MGCEDGPSDDGEARGVRLEISHNEMDLSGILWKHSSKKPLEDGVGPRTKAIKFSFVQHNKSSKKTLFR